MNKDKLQKVRDLNFLVGGLAAALAGFGFGVITTMNSLREKSIVIPDVKEVQQGYVAPSDLRIECRDFDGDGINDTYVITKDGCIYFMPSTKKTVNYQLWVRKK